MWAKGDERKKIVIEASPGKAIRHDHKRTDSPHRLLHSTSSCRTGAKCSSSKSTNAFRWSALLAGCTRGLEKVMHTSSRHILHTRYTRNYLADTFSDKFERKSLGLPVITASPVSSSLTRILLSNFTQLSSFQSTNFDENLVSNMKMYFRGPTGSSRKKN